MSHLNPDGPMSNAATPTADSKPKHTPGPWTPHMEGVFAEDRCIGICDTDSEGEERDIANTRLMAAAPDLLAALAEYVVLGKGKCTIGKATADKGLAAINFALSGERA